MRPWSILSGEERKGRNPGHDVGPEEKAGLFTFREISVR